MLLAWFVGALVLTVVVAFIMALVFDSETAQYDWGWGSAQDNAHIIVLVTAAVVATAVTLIWMFIVPGISPTWQIIAPMVAGYLVGLAAMYWFVAGL
jgi:hypothetical protein